jgi:hypothetical protein
MVRLRSIAACAAVIGASGCGGEAQNLPEGCQPLLSGADCLLPYPSDFFLRDDATLPSGKRLVIAASAIPHVKETNHAADPNAPWAPDGFSTLSPIVAIVGTPVSASGLTPLDSAPGDTTTASSRTLIIESGTGRLVPHYADLDPRATNPARQGIVLHPLAPLAPKTRYVVALQGILQPDGMPALPPEGFRRLRDEEASGDPALEALEPRFEAEVFPAIEALGIERSSLLLAWSFTTVSREHSTGDMLEVRRAALEWLSANQPEVAILGVEENPSDEIWRTVQGTVSVPLFMESDDAGARLSRDSSGKVVQNGTTKFKFLAQIPASVRDQSAPGSVLGYGHGFFGLRTEANSEAAIEIFNQLGAVGFAIDWWGMSQDDLFLIVDGLVNAPDESLIFTDRVHQAMVNWIVLQAALEGPMREMEAMKRPNGDVVYDASHPAFLGISLGHILGGVLAAVHPSLERVILHVGGAGFSHVMMRSRSFRPFLTLLEDALPDPLDQQKFVALTATQMDRIDPGTYAPFVFKEPLEGNRQRRLLLQIGLGDVQVPNLGAFFHARALELPILEPVPHQVYGLTPASAPIDGSALALYDFGIDLSVYAKADPPDRENVVHDGLRTTRAAISQLSTFFREGRVINPCDGTCDPQ